MTIAPALERLLRFGVVGGLGFLVDTGTLLALVQGGGFNALAAKTLSFGVAVVVTFECNRRWTFETDPAGWMARFIPYLGVQAGGFLVNGAVFALVEARLAPSPAAILAGSALASLAALVLNFLGARRFVFQGAEERGA